MTISPLLGMNCCGALLLGATLAPASAVGQETPVERLFFDGLETFEPAVLRINRLELLDPHLFTLVIGCIDVTATFNGQIDSEINGDSNGDGFLDSSPVLLMEPFAPPDSGRLAQGEGVCSAPVESSECAIANAGAPVPFEARETGLCRGPLQGTTSGYIPGVPNIGGPCFTGRPSARQLSLNGVELALLDGVAAGSFTAASPNGIDSGLLRGFVSETDAGNTLIPPEVPVIGGQPLASLLPGGAGNCASGDDRDTLNGETGWWFYLAFEAERVPVAGSGVR